MAVSLNALLENTQLLHPNEVEDQTCPICFDDYLQDQSRELPRRLPCGHIVGTECLLQWASAQNGTSAIKCPRCTQPVIDPPGARQFLEIVVSLVDVMDEQVGALMHWLYITLDRAFEEQKVAVLVATSLLVLLGAHFNTFLAWYPLYILYVYAVITLKDRLLDHRYLGLFFIALGFCVGEFVKVRRDLGINLMAFGHVAYRDDILRIYKDHRWIMLGGTFGGFMVLQELNYPEGGPVGDVLVLHFVGCLMNTVLGWMVR
ncbi:hypothetical protein BDR22DRAFT_895221 [Usnea florida]